MWITISHFLVQKMGLDAETLNSSKDAGGGHLRLSSNISIVSDP